MIAVWTEAMISPPSTAKAVKKAVTVNIDERLQEAIHAERAAGHPFRSRRHHEREEIGNLFRLPITADLGCSGEAANHLTPT
jgi:hypothetical protein